tara:strand:- start:1981 stop:3060 length:1080 start_codon:yes stop_codon:yes gene_type:complete
MIALSLLHNKKLKLVNKKISKKVPSSQCRLEILYSGICASDIPRAFESMAYRYPLIMGHEFIGRVIDTGSKCKNFETGDIVSAFPLIPCSVQSARKSCIYCDEKKFNLCDNYDYYGSRRDGSFCEVLDVNEWNLFKLNKKHNLKLYSLIEPTAVSFNIIENLKKIIGSNLDILVIGAGYIGQIVSRILNSQGKKNHIYILDRNKFKLDFVKKYSFKQILVSNKNFNKENFVSQFNSKFDIVIEATGKDTNFLNALNFAKKDGTVIFAGNIDNQLLFTKNQVSNILRKQLTIKGIWNSSFKSKIDNWKKSEKFISNNHNMDQLITHVSELDSAAELLKNIYLKKKGEIKNNYLKGLIKSF